MCLLHITIIVYIAIISGEAEKTKTLEFKFSQNEIYSLNLSRLGLGLGNFFLLRIGLELKFFRGSAFKKNYKCGAIKMKYNTAPVGNNARLSYSASGDEK